MEHNLLSDESCDFTDAFFDNAEIAIVVTCESCKTTAEIVVENASCFNLEHIKKAGNRLCEMGWGEDELQLYCSDCYDTILLDRYHEGEHLC